MFTRPSHNETASTIVRRYSALTRRRMAGALFEPQVTEELPRNTSRWRNPWGVVLMMAGFVVFIIVLAAVYYFNVFVELEQNVATAQAQIDRELQRRSDLIKNLLPAVFEYAELEKHVFTEVAKVRTHLAGMMQQNLAEVPPDGIDSTLLQRTPSMQAEQGPTAQAKAGTETGAGAEANTPAPNAAADPFSELVGRLFAVSEQYPDMKSSAPFQMLMDKITEIEDRLAVERQKYNDSVNTYTTISASFPGKVFAQLFGFKDRQLFTADPDAHVPPKVAWPMVE